MLRVHVVDEAHVGATSSLHTVTTICWSECRHTSCSTTPDTKQSGRQLDAYNCMQQAPHNACKGMAASSCTHIVCLATFEDQQHHVATAGSNVHQLDGLAQVGHVEETSDV